MEKFWITSEALYDLLNDGISSGTVRMQEYNYLRCVISNSGRCYEYDREWRKPEEYLDIEDKELLEIGEPGENEALRGEQRIFFISKTAVIQLIQKGVYVTNDLALGIDDE